MLRDIPGLVVASPSTPGRRRRHAAHLRAAARATARVCVFLEPIALYHTRDLHEAGDGRWLAPYAPPEHGRRATSRSAGDAPTATGEDLTMVTFGNGLSA